jgi:lauroyl/myristoyl acyltransferase
MVLSLFNIQRSGLINWYVASSRRLQVQDKGYVLWDNEEIVKAMRELRSKEMGYLAVSQKQSNAAREATLFFASFAVNQFKNR